MRCLEFTLTDNSQKTVIRSYHSRLSPGRLPYREHHHTECELSVFLAGRGNYAVGEKVLPFAPGAVFLFGSNEAHCIVEITEDIDLLNIHFEPKLLWEHAENIELLQLFNARSKNFSNRFADTDRTLQRLITDLEQELSRQKTCHGLQARCFLYSALVHMIRRYDCVDSSKISDSPSAVTASIGASMQYMEEHLDTPMTLKEIADVACMSPSYFSTVFKKLNGISPWEYITIKRVEKAIDMLKNTDLTKLAIAEQCGFSSSSNFYKAFTHIPGKKPSDYIRH